MVTAAMFVVPAPAASVPSLELERPPTESGATVDVERLLDRWERSLQAWLDRAEELPETRAGLVSADRRSSDGSADLTGLVDALELAGAELDAAAERLTSARGRHLEASDILAAAEEALAHAEADVAGQRLTMDDHAARIYKYGATELGAIETILRSGSPGEYLVHRRMHGAVLSYDHHVYLDLVAVRDAAAEEVTQARRQVETTGWQLRRRQEEHEGAERFTEAVDDTVRRQRSAVAGASAAQRSQAAAVRGAELVIRERRDEMITVETTLGEAGVPEGEERAERRRIEEERLDEQVRESYPFLERTAFRRPLRFPSVAGFTCPVPDGRFMNDWAFPRPGGRTHQGTDISAPRGTPVLAVADGVVIEVDREDRYRGGIRGDLGGRTLSVRTADGERWYFAHLDTIDPGLMVGDPVEAGQQIGTVGDSGNARGGPPHLHLGRYVDDIAANPWPAMHIACRDDTD